MNNLLNTVALMLISMPILANPIEELNKNIVYSFNSPLKYMVQNKNKNYWFAYSVPVQENTRSSCCWNQSSSSSNETQACDLSKEINSFGRSDKSLKTERNNIFIQVKNNTINKIIPVGESCQVKASGMQIDWLQDVTELKSIDFLKQLSLKRPEQIANNALYAMSMHKSKQAAKELYEIAQLEQHGLSSNAVFWLGEARTDGIHYLKSLYKSLPNGETKKHINFALAQSDDKNGLKLLKEIAVNDSNTSQRSDALFWLAEKNPKITKKIYRIFK